MTFLPPPYPSHDYAGQGLAYRVRIDGRLVGYLTTVGDPVEAVDWLPSPQEDDRAQLVAAFVRDGLHTFARDGVPIEEGVARVLALVKDYDGPDEVDLATLRA